jgi:hypothetical protein
MEEAGGEFRAFVNFISQADHATAVTLVVHILTSFLRTHNFIYGVFVDTFSIVDVRHTVAANWVFSISSS